jgi:hypothetical protein
MWPARADILLDDSYPMPLRTNLQAVANDIFEIVTDLFHRRPTLDLPIVCHIDRARPITSLDNWAHPTKILIGLTPEQDYWAQFAYQLRHELGHVMLGPRRTNGIVETISTALAYEVLDRITDKWAIRVPFPFMRGWEHNFRDYRIDDERTRLARLPQEIQDSVANHKWKRIRQYLSSHRSDLDQLGPIEIESEHGRDIQSLGAIALRSAPIRWDEFTDIAVHIQPPLSAKDQSMFLVGPLDRSYLNHLDGALCPIGLGCCHRFL